MGLSVGVVSIDYLDEPQPPISEFLKDLATDPELGSDWGGGWGGNTFAEFEESSLNSHVDKWCEESGISASARIIVMSWVSGLPWRDGYIMLHLAG